MEVQVITLTTDQLLREGLEHYADESKWVCMDDGNMHANQLYLNADHGYSVAADTLAEVKKMEGGVS